MFYIGQLCPIYRAIVIKELRSYYYYLTDSVESSIEFVGRFSEHNEIFTVFVKK